MHSVPTINSATVYTKPNKDLEQLAMLSDIAQGVWSGDLLHSEGNVWFLSDSHH